MKLKVLAGAKEGTEIPLKRSKFLIGRSSECTLRAGSEAISRRHCVVLTTERGVSVRDLGSRNGTLVNGIRIDGETVLRPGDMIKVGPLEFEFLGAPADIKSAKKPKVKSVAEAVDRAASQSQEADVGEDDISRWLLGPDTSSSNAMRETMSFRIDETRASKVVEPPKSDKDQTPAGGDSEEDAAESVGDNEPDEKKPRFGKLPQMPKKPLAKDSCEAAADILREMSRRR